METVDKTVGLDNLSILVWTVDLLNHSASEAQQAFSFTSHITEETSTKLAISKVS